MLEFPVDELCQFGQEFQQWEETAEVGEDDEVLQHTVVDAGKSQVIVFVEGIDQLIDHAVVFHKCVAPSHLACAATLTNSQEVCCARQFDAVFDQWFDDRLQVGGQPIGFVKAVFLQYIPAVIDRLMVDADRKEVVECHLFFHKPQLSAIALTAQDDVTIVGADR